MQEQGLRFHGGRARRVKEKGGAATTELELRSNHRRIGGRSRERGVSKLTNLPDGERVPEIREAEIERVINEKTIATTDRGGGSDPKTTIGTKVGRGRGEGNQGVIRAKNSQKKGRTWSPTELAGQPHRGTAAPHRAAASIVGDGGLRVLQRRGRSGSGRLHMFHTARENSASETRWLTTRGGRPWKGRRAVEREPRAMGGREAVASARCRPEGGVRSPPQSPELRVMFLSPMANTCCGIVILHLSQYSFSAMSRVTPR